MIFGAIYGLYHPVTNELRYVGQTKSTLKRRFCTHLSSARTGKEYPVSRWMRKRLAEDLRPVIRSIEDDVPVGHLNSREEHWIAYFRAHGAKLLNCTEGGDGGWEAALEVARTPEVRAKAAATHRARNAEKTDEERRSHPAVIASHTPEALAKLSVSQKANWAKLTSEEHRARTAAWIEAAHTPEAHARRIAKQKANGAFVRNGKAWAESTNTLRYRCDECGRVMNPGGLGTHQKHSGHTGKTRVSSKI